MNVDDEESKECILLLGAVLNGPSFHTKGLTFDFRNPNQMATGDYGKVWSQQRFIY